jgi:hypothetical protein
MPLRIRFQHVPGASLAYSIERLADGLYFDFSDGTFKANPTTPVAGLTAGTGIYASRYAAVLTPTPPSQFANGEYAIGIHDTASANALIGLMAARMYNGDDAPIFPAEPIENDLWETPLPGSYPPGTAGHIVGTFLDAAVSTRSTYAGGPVASVLAPVIVGENQDKSGYVLAASGLDAIPIEEGVNARQALSPILAAAAGRLSGAGSETVTIQGGNVATTRITATCDSLGNRSSVVLTLPD